MSAQPLAEEEQARANIYALLARLFYAAPDAQLLSELVHAPQIPEGDQSPQGKEYAAAWRALVEACRSAYPVVLENEHTELFASPGKAEVTPYLLHYAMRYESESPLVALREQLAQWRLARRAGAQEPEDHISGLCDVMRIAIAVQQRPLAEQQAFFERFLYPGAMGFCSAVTASPKSHFYGHVVRLARAFFELEHETLRLA